jgi:DNA-directed RNA polymerase subunit M/transcription elongation factor TFIIS
MNCLFCCDADTDDKTEAGKDLICPLCVQMLLTADQEDLRRAYCKAIEREYDRKAKAIKSFLIEGEITNERETKKSKRGAIRKKPMPMVRPTIDRIRPQQTTV